MKLAKIQLAELDVSHLESDTSCFYVVNTNQQNSEFLRNTPLFISEDYKLYGVSYGTYKSMEQFNINKFYAIIVPGDYLEKFDFYLQNITSNVTLKYENIRKKYKNKEVLLDSEFDENQIDLMYSTRLEQRLDEVEVEKEVLEVKRAYKLTIVLKTIEDNEKIQKYFHISRNLTHNKDGQKQKELIIDFDYFKRIAIDKKGPPVVNRLFDEKEDTTLVPFPSLTIECTDMKELNAVLDFLKINKEKLKTTRVNFKRLEKILK